jgi:hypothetical protein
MRIKIFIAVIFLALLVVSPAIADTALVSTNWSGYSTATDGLSPATKWQIEFNITRLIIPSAFQLDTYFNYVGLYSDFPPTAYTVIDYWQEAAHRNKIATVTYALTKTMDVAAAHPTWGNAAKGTLHADITELNESWYYNLTSDYSTDPTTRTIRYDNISEGVHGNGLYIPHSVNTEINRTKVMQDIGFLFTTNHGTIFNYWQSMTDDRTFTVWASGGNVTPPGVTCANFTAQVRNAYTFNKIAPSVFYLWDVTDGTSQKLSLPTGSGSIGIDATQVGHSFVWNGTATGFEPSVAYGRILDATQCGGNLVTALSPIYSGVNATLLFIAYDGFTYDETGNTIGIPGAQVELTDGQTQTTNSAGAATFSVLQNGSYGYTVTKEGYDGYESSITLYMDTNQTIYVPLYQSTAPTPVPTETPTCSSGDLPCNLNEIFRFIIDNLRVLIYLAYCIMLLTLIWMFIYAASGRIPGYKNQGGRGGGSIFGSRRR